MRTAPGRDLTKFWRTAVHSSFVPDSNGSPENWKARLADSPDSLAVGSGPRSCKVARKQEQRAIQLGLVGDILRKYAQDWILGIEDISEFCHRTNAQTQNQINLRVFEALSHLAKKFTQLSIDPETAKRIGVDRNLKLKHRYRHATYLPISPRCADSGLRRFRL